MAAYSAPPQLAALPQVAYRREPWAVTSLMRPLEEEMREGWEVP